MDYIYSIYHNGIQTPYNRKYRTTRLLRVSENWEKSLTMLRFVFIPLFRIGARIRKQDNHDANKTQIINSTTDTNVTNLSQTAGTCSVNNTLDTGCSLPKA